ncbi:MAG: biopolymer transporter ExbD [Proteobacteria bacterium]|nr:biopolymer transporter ExbD [Pseudomonadota bacterium]
MKVSKRYSGKARIEMIPLIDVVFLLLVAFIFMMMSMVVHRGIPVDLPQSSTSCVDKKDFISIGVRADGKIFLEKEEVTLDELLSRLSSRHDKFLEMKVVIMGDKKAPYERVISVMDMVRKSGIVSLSLETKWKE